MHGENSLKIGDWNVSPECNHMRRGETCHHVEPKAMAVLLELARTPNKVVRRRQLLDKVWPRTFSGDEALTRCVSQLRSCFGDDAHKPQYIETIPKKGYRLVAPCSNLAATLLPSRLEPGTSQPNNIESESDHAEIPPVVTANLGARKFRATKLLFLVVVTALLIRFVTHEVEHLTRNSDESEISVITVPAHSIYVMPFNNLTGYPEDDFFANDLVTTIRSGASKTGEISVIANNFANVVAEDTADLKSLAAEIGATAILTGSVQRSAHNVRVTAQLTDGYSGFSIWSKSFNHRDSDIFAVQDKVASSIVFELRNSLVDQTTVTTVPTTKQQVPDTNLPPR